jgi:hypothetical protein
MQRFLHHSSVTKMIFDLDENISTPELAGKSTGGEERVVEG